MFPKCPPDCSTASRNRKSSTFFPSSPSARTAARRSKKLPSHHQPESRSRRREEAEEYNGSRSPPPHVGGYGLSAQPALQRNHRRNFREDVREELRELVDAAFEAAEAPDCLEEFLPADVPGLVSIKQGRVVEKSLHGVGFGGAPPGNSPRGDAVIEVNQDLAQIEDDGVGLAHDNFNSVLPSSALLNVSSSAYSSPLPAGRPWAMRVTLMARAARRLAR